MVRLTVMVSLATDVIVRAKGAEQMTYTVTRKYVPFVSHGETPGQHYYLISSERGRG